MKRHKRLYHNEDWYAFSNKVQYRDNYKCLKCGRSNLETTLQTHHTAYKRGYAPWDYPLSDCITLCKGCHAIEHGIIEPKNGWTLISIDDLDGLYGVCEMKGCGTEIRYEHVIYHPKCGFKSVGSTCVDYLTAADQFVSQEILNIYKKISDFINTSSWDIGHTKSKKQFLFTTHQHHQIRIYGSDNNYSFQLLLKEKGVKWFEYGKFIDTPNKNLNQVKELGYIALKGMITEDDEKKELLRHIYKMIR